ncbi:MAG: hypothetical protein OXH04_07085 [Acidobacteria bacterium]|nr:hypothetical protein [Acidobacteriota bacterium]
MSHEELSAGAEAAQEPDLVPFELPDRVPLPGFQLLEVLRVLDLTVFRQPFEQCLHLGGRFIAQLLEELLGWSSP